MRLAIIMAVWVAMAFTGLAQTAKPKLSVATIAELAARAPAATNEEAEVRNFSATVLWDQPRTFRNDATATNTHDGVHYITNRSIAGRWVSADRLSLVQRVAWFGATGDGTTDDTAAIESALTYSGTIGAQTHLEAVKSYNVDDVSISGTAQLVGNGSTFKSDGLDNFKSLVAVQSSANVTISGVVFDMSGVVNRYAYGVGALQATNIQVRIEDCSFTNYPASAVLFSQASGDYVVRRSKFLNGRAHSGTVGEFSLGVTVSSGGGKSTLLVEDSGFLNSISYDAGKLPTGILVSGGPEGCRAIVQRCTFVRCGTDHVDNLTAGIDFYQQAPGSIIRDCSFSGCSFSLKLQEQADIEVTGCLIDGTNSVAGTTFGAVRGMYWAPSARNLYVPAPRGLRVVGNVFKNFTNATAFLGSGGLTNSTGDLYVIGNRFESVGRGIDMRYLNGFARFSDNTITNASQYGITLSGQSTGATNDLLIEGGSISMSGGSSINILDTPGAITVRNVSIRGHDGFYTVSPGGSVTIQDCSILATNGHGIAIIATNNVDARIERNSTVVLDTAYRAVLARNLRSAVARDNVVTPRLEISTTSGTATIARLKNNRVTASDIMTGSQLLVDVEAEQGSTTNLAQITANTLGVGSLDGTMTPRLTMFGTTNWGSEIRFSNSTNAVDARFSLRFVPSSDSFDVVGRDNSGGVFANLFSLSRLGGTARISAITTNTGDLTVGGNLIVGDGSALSRYIISDASSNSASGLRIKRGGVDRWVLRTTGTESTSNAGGNLELVNYSDIGVALSTPVSINRATGLFTHNTDTTFGANVTIGGVSRSTWPSSTSYTEGDGVRVVGTTISTDLAAGSNVTLSTNGSGQITISSSGGGGGPTNGSAVYIDSVQATTANFVDSPEVDPSISGTNVSLALVPNSIETNKLSVAAYQALVNRSLHTGTQLVSTISDFGTNVWTKILSSIARGNGIHMSTNAGANTLTFSGWYLPGANMTFTTNGDSSITIAAASSGSTNGTPLTVNGSAVLTLANLTNLAYSIWGVSGSNVTLTITNLPQSSVSNLVADLSAKQAANTNLLQIATAGGSPGDILFRHASGVLTNLPVGSSGHVLTVAAGVPSWQSPSGGAGGAGTNLFVNGLLRQPARITNSTTVTWSTNSNGDIVATATNSAGTTAEVLQRVGWVKFDVYTDGGTDPTQSAWSNYVQNVQVGGVITNAYLVGGPTALVTARYSGGIDVQVNLPLSGLSDTNWLVLAQPMTRISTNSAYASSFVDVIGGSLASTNIPLILGTYPNVGFSLGAANTPNFHRWTNSYYVTVLAPAVVGGSGGNAVALNSSGFVTNLANGPDITWSSSGGTTATPILTDSGTAGTFTSPVVTTSAKGRITSIVSGPEPASQSRRSFVIYDELLGNTTSTGGQGVEGAINAGGIGIPTTEAGRPGLRYLRSAGANQGSLMGWINASTIRGPAVASQDVFYFESEVKVPATLSGAAGTDQYAIQVGFHSLNSGTNTPGDGSYIVHQTNLIGSVNWAFITTSNSISATVIDTGVPVTASTWYTLGVRLDATNTIAFINDTPVATNNTRLPLGRNLNAIVRAPRYSGSTTIDVLLDWFKLKWDGDLR